MTPERSRAARELLAFYAEAGVDALIGETPVDRFAGSEGREDVPAAQPAPVSGPSPRPVIRDRPPPQPSPAGHPATQASRGPASGGGSPPPPTPEAAVMAAREAAKSAASLEALRAILDRFEGCALRGTAKQLVFADGNPQARVMFVGEAPGRDEDIEGLPFVGRSGKLLDRMIAAIGLDRSKAYIANIVPWRPPGNRTPTPQESAICLPFTLRQIELANPDILVCLGNPSTQTLLNSKEGIIKTRGRWFPFHTGTRAS